MRLARRASRIGAVALAAVLYGAAAQAADLRVGYIDSSRIFVEFKEAQEAQQRFDRLVTGWRDEALEKEKAVQQMRDEVRDQSPILSAMRRQEKEAALQRAISEYDAFIQDVWGPSGRASTENERATGEIVQRIRVAVEKVASEKGLELVLDAASGYLVYADKNLDLTTEVLTELAASSTSGAK
ncbi:MAG: OmpH family outer membrane protein [Candidatus Eisenbacteria bacterium]|nr:OmpH family outer membrane protein [Candidatus Eisenbacteria bacterium]